MNAKFKETYNCQFLRFFVGIFFGVDLGADHLGRLHSRDLLLECYLLPQRPVIFAETSKNSDPAMVSC